MGTGTHLFPGSPLPAKVGQVDAASSLEREHSRQLYSVRPPGKPSVHSVLRAAFQAGSAQTLAGPSSL